MSIKTSNYILNEQIYESADKSIRIFKSRRKFTVQYIAIKQYSKASHENPSYEYSLLKNLSHANIVKVYNFTEDSNFYNMEMEYCVSQDLSKSIWHNRLCQYSDKVVKHLASQLIKAVMYLHKNNIIHCNLKPSNIIVDDYGLIRLCDFKKALLINKININDIKKNKSAMTPCYTAPELFAENGIYDYKTDIWAIGCIIFELAVGQVPFFEESVNKLITKIINETVNFNRKELLNYSEDFIDLLKGMLEKDLTKRYSWNEIESHPFWECSYADIHDYQDLDNNNNNNNSKERVNSGRNTKSIYNNQADTSKISNSTSNQVKYGQQIKNLNNNNNYQRGNNDKKEVEVPDQEFNFEGEKKEDEEIQDENIDRQKIKNPLEVSVLNISTVFNKEKEKQKRNKFDELDKSISKEDITIDSLLLHQSDKLIKPIIGNKIIESIPETVYIKNRIPVVILKIDKIKELIKTNQLQRIESFLFGVYSYIDQYFNTIGNEDSLLNLLSYFETLIQDKEIANKIINTSFISLLFKILKSNSCGNNQNTNSAISSKSNISNNTQTNNIYNQIKIRVCTIIAYLIRYSTMIETPLDDLNYCQILENLVLNSKNIEISRRALATLGEYLFFVATQAEGEEENNIWIVSDSSLLVLLNALDSKDDIIKFYAVKTIENISALTGIAEIYFAKESYLVSILEIYSSTKIVDLKSSAIYTVGHLIRLKPSLYEVFVSKFPLNKYITTYSVEDNNIKRALINCIVYGIRSNQTYNYINTSNEDLYIKIISHIIENIETSDWLLKMKIILLLCFYVNDINTLLLYDKLRLFNTIQKIKKEQQKEIKHSIKFFENSISNALTPILKTLKVYITGIKSSINSNNVNVNLNMNNIRIYFNIFTKISEVPKLSDVLFRKTEFLERLNDIMNTPFLLEDSLIQNYLFNILTKLSEQKNIIEEFYDIIIDKLLLSILNLIDILDNKITILTVSAYILTYLFDDENIYSSTIVEDERSLKINHIILSILPKLSDLILQPDLTLTILSFLSIILERNTAFIQYYKSERIIEKILRLVSDSNYSSNLNIIKILIKLIESNLIKFEEIILLHMIDKISIIVMNDYDEQSIYLEYVVELLYDLMIKINEEKRNFSNTNTLNSIEFSLFIKKIEKISIHFQFCIKLIGHDNPTIQEKVVISLMFILQLLGGDTIESTGVVLKFRDCDIPDLLKGLEYNCTRIHKRMIKIFRWIIEYQNDANVVLAPYVNYISSYVENICNLSKENEVVQLGL